MKCLDRDLEVQHNSARDCCLPRLCGRCGRLWLRLINESYKINVILEAPLLVKPSCPPHLHRLQALLPVHAGRRVKEAKSVEEVIRRRLQTRGVQSVVVGRPGLRAGCRARRGRYAQGLQGSKHSCRMTRPVGCVMKLGMHRHPEYVEHVWDRGSGAKPGGPQPPSSHCPNTSGRLCEGVVGPPMIVKFASSSQPYTHTYFPLFTRSYVHFHHNGHRDFVVLLVPPY